MAEELHRKMGVFSFTKQGKRRGKTVQEQYEWAGTPVSLDRNPTISRGLGRS